MTGRERFLTVLGNGKPDRLACQMHRWMPYYLDTYLGGVDEHAAYARFGMDPVIYVNPWPIYAHADQANWQEESTELERRDGNRRWRRTVTTPAGVLTEQSEANEFTSWITEHIIKSKTDFEIWNQYVPVPSAIDWNPVIEAKLKVGETGIVRGGFFDFGQGSPWQSFGILYGTERMIMLAMDEPAWLEEALEAMLAKKLKAIERGGRFELDLVETGGGAGSNTVISPALHRRFCLPYDRRQHDALHAAGAKVVYHLCGGVMALLETVVENGADGLETMTPASMGADCDLAEANRRVGDKLFFVGGFDQNRGFEKGDPATVRQMVCELFEACPEGGYICCPSDHFFFGDPENVQAFADAAKECVYS